MMFKKLCKYIAANCESNSLLPVALINEARLFKPLCILEKKKYLGFWKKASMSPTSLQLRDLLTKDVNLSSCTTDSTITNNTDEDTTLKVGTSVASKIASEFELEFAADDKMSLVFKIGDVEKHDVPYENLLEALEDNPIDLTHPVYLNMHKCLKTTFCIVVESLCTKDDGSLEQAHALLPATEAETRTYSTVTVDIQPKDPTENKCSYSFKVPPRTVLAYKCVEFTVDCNGKICPQSHPEYFSDSKEEAELPLPDVTLCVNEEEVAIEPVPIAYAKETYSNDAEDVINDDVASDYEEDDDLEAPILIRYTNQEGDPIGKIKDEFDALVQLGYFGKLKMEIRTMLTDATEDDFQLVYLLLYRANLYIGSDKGRKFIPISALRALIGDETKFTWKTVMTRLGFSVPKDATDCDAYIVYPKKDDRGILQAFMGMIGSIININTHARRLVVKMSVEHLRLIMDIVEMQLQNRKTFLTDVVFDAMVQKEPLMMVFLAECGFHQSSEDDNVLVFTPRNLTTLLDVYAIAYMLSTGKKHFLKNTPSFSKDKKKPSMIPRRLSSSFRRLRTDKGEQSADDANLQTTDARVSVGQTSEKHHSTEVC